MFGYDLAVEYQPGKQNAAVDALSRREEGVLALMALFGPSFSVFDDLRHEYASNAQVQAVRAALVDGLAAQGWTEVR